MFLKNNYTKNFILSDIQNKINSQEKYIFDYKINRKGVFFKTLLLLSITTLSAVAMFFICHYLGIKPKGYESSSTSLPTTMCLFSFLCMLMCLGICITSNFCSLNKQKILAISYSFLHGISLGFSFVTLNLFYDNIGNMLSIAVLSVMVLFLMMHFAYYNNLVTVNHKFIKYVSLSLFFIFIGNIIILFFSNFLNTFGTFGSTIFLIFIMFSLIIGCMRLIIDFHQAEQIINLNLDKRYEWKIAFSFQITLFYIFYEIVRLLLYFNMFHSRNNR